MKAIKIELHQPTANYKIGQSFQYRETYPLPPYSTISGLTHHLAKFTTYHPMQISIQGNIGNKTSDLYTRYETNGSAGSDSDFYKINKKTKEKTPLKRQRWNLVLHDKNQTRKLALLRGIAHNELLTNIDLTIHIVPEKQEDLKAIYNAFKFPFEFVSLGRREDLAEIKNVKLVDLHEKQLSKTYSSSQGAYIPATFIKTLNQQKANDFNNGTYFYLTTSYTPTKLKNKTYRKWQKTKAMYKESYKINANEQIIMDSDNVPVFLA